MAADDHTGPARDQAPAGERWGRLYAVVLAWLVVVVLLLTLLTWAYR